MFARYQFGASRLVRIELGKDEVCSGDRLLATLDENSNLDQWKLAGWGPWNWIVWKRDF